MLQFQVTPQKIIFNEDHQKHTCNNSDDWIPSFSSVSSCPGSRCSALFALVLRERPNIAFSVESVGALSWIYGLTGYTMPSFTQEGVSSGTSLRQSWDPMPGSLSKYKIDVFVSVHGEESPLLSHSNSSYWCTVLYLHWSSESASFLLNLFEPQPGSDLSGTTQHLWGACHSQSCPCSSQQRAPVA